MHYMGSWHLLAWCSVRRDIRDFALSRIRSIEPYEEAIHLPDDLPSIKDYTRKYFGIMQGSAPVEAVLRFSPKSTAWVSEQIWHPGTRKPPQNRTEVSCSSFQWLISVNSHRKS